MSKTIEISRELADLKRIVRRMIKADKILELWTSNERAAEAEFEFQEAFGELKAAIEGDKK